MSDLNRRLKIDNNIIYPVTKAENVIGLNKRIVEKAPLPILSNNEPENASEGIIWLDSSNSDSAQEVSLQDDSTENTPQAVMMGQRILLYNLNDVSSNNNENNHVEGSQENNYSNVLGEENNYTEEPQENNYTEEPQENNYTK